MNFDFTEEQDMLRESLSRLLRDKYDFEARTKILESEEGWSRDVWNQLAEMGVMGAAFPEEYDGFGGTAIDTIVLMEEFGRALLVEPFLPTVILCGGLLKAAGGEKARQLIASIISGETVMAFGYAEPTSRFDLFQVETTAEQSADGFVLNGRKAVVLGAPIADKIIISARTGGGAKDRDGISLFLVDRNADGVSVMSYPTIDGLQAGDVMLDNVKIATDDVIGEIGAAGDIIESVIDQAIIAVAAESMGLCHKMCELTNEYTKTREQFGQPISRFQVLQHRMVDMFIFTEEMKSITYMAAMKVDSDAEDTRVAASMAKVQLGKSNKFVGESAIQLHGGMGITEEMSVGHYFMHATMLEALFGNTNYHLNRYEQLTGLRAA